MPGGCGTGPGCRSILSIFSGTGRTKRPFPKRNSTRRSPKYSEKDRWIIDGNFSRTLERRLAECDTVFLFDLPLADCIAGVEARIGTKREDMPWIETEFDPEFREFITHFSETRLPNIYALLEKHRDKTLTVFHSRAECEVYKIPAAEA